MMISRNAILARILVSSAALAVTLPCGAEDDASSMFNEDVYRSLVADVKAVRVGDVLTVIVQESATASSSTDLKSQRGFSANAELQLPKIGKHGGAASTKLANDGMGSTQRSGRLLAQLSVRVISASANGDLVIQGQQSLKINGEDQQITLSGLVRARDVSADNTVLSSRIAEARIQFDGEGFVTDHSRPGLLGRVLNFLGL